MSASAEMNEAFPNVVEVDAARGPVILRILRLGQRHDRVILTLDDTVLTVSFNDEGDDLGVTRGGGDAIRLEL